MNQADLVPLITTAIAAGATLLAVVIANRHNLRIARLNNDSQSRRSATELRLAKLEELYTLFDQWQLALINIYLTHLRCFVGKLTFNQAQDAVLRNVKLNNGEAQRYLMLLDLYFPTLRAEYTPIEEARAKLSPFLDDPSKTRLRADDFVELQKEFEDAAKRFKRSLCSFAKVTFM